MSANPFGRMAAENRKVLKRTELNLKTIGNGIPKAMSSAVKRVSAGIKTDAARKVRDTYFVKHSDVINTLSVRPDQGGDGIVLVSRGPTIPLSKFKVSPASPEAWVKKWKRGGMLKVGVKRGGTMQPLKSVFLTKFQSGHLAVAQRKGKGRFPIDELYGPAIPSMLAQPGMAEYLMNRAQERMSDRLPHEVNRVMGRLKS